MADLNFITTYMPAFVDIPTDDVADTRDRLESYIREGFPEMDINPNTVVGDLVITPMAYTIAALELGMDHFMSDLNLANVANDVIYNCDFVEAYLQNFNVSPDASLQPSGVVRLVFSEDDDYYLDRSIRFSFNDAVFEVYYTQSKLPYRIHKSGTPVVVGEDGTVLKDSGSDAYFADIPVVGVSGTVEVAASTSGQINSAAYLTLGAITALCDFDTGAVTKTLPQMAADTRKTIYAASMNTRNGAIQYINTTCPFVDGVYAIISGDKEMTRAYTGSGLAAENCLDLYVRSKSYAFEESQPLKLTLKTASDNSQYFEGDFDYVGQPYHITSLTSEGSTLDSIPHSITASVPTTSPVSMPVAAYTPYEQLKIKVPYSTVVSGKVVVNTGLEGIAAQIRIDTDGTQYAYFNITYNTDPMLQEVARTVTNASNSPVNMDVLARGFIPIIISQFEVQYVKSPGIQVLQDEAVANIKEYLTGLGVPDVYSDGQISKIMDEAGAKYVRGINVSGKVQWSVADKMVNSAGNTVDVKVGPYINSSADLRISYEDTSETPVQYACSIRNVRYYLLDGAVTLSEVKEV